jgi:hypothetical protein
MPSECRKSESLSEGIPAKTVQSFEDEYEHEDEEEEDEYGKSSRNCTIFNVSNVERFSCQRAQ